MSSFCPGCGNSMAEGERYCTACGRDSEAGGNVAAVEPQLAFGLPPESSGTAIFSLICGIFFILPFSLVAVIFGYIALSEIRKSPGRLKGRGLAVTGIVLGCVGVLFIVAPSRWESTEFARLPRRSITLDLQEARDRWSCR